MFFLTLQPELVQRVERDLLNIMAGGTAENIDILISFLHCLLIDTKIDIFLLEIFHTSENKGCRASPSGSLIRAFQLR